MVQGQAPRLRPAQAAIWALLAGAAHALALAWPGNGQALGALQWLALAVLAHLYLRTETPRQAAFMGWCFATAQGVAATWWLYISMHQYGGMPAPLAAAAVLLLQAALGLYLAFTLGLAAWLRHRSTRRQFTLLAFSGAWLLAELARAEWFTGFPWGAAGYAHVDSALAVLAPWVGVYGMGAVSAALAMGLALAWRGPTPLMRGGVWVMSGAVLLALSQPWRAPDTTREAGRVPLTLLQGNVPQDQKFTAQRDSATLWYLQQIAQAGPGLTLAPETAIVLPPDLWPADWWAALRPQGPDRGVMVGVPWRNPTQGGWGNSVLAWGSGPPTHPTAPGADYRYDKHHLVPFGEFIPWGFSWFVHAMHIPLADFERGASPQPTWTWGGWRWAPNICFEDLFGEQLARSLAGPDSPHVLVNFSNIAWFGDTVAQAQHLNISRLRTLELQRPMVRVTNTGTTAVIDHRAVVQDLAPVWQRTVLKTQVSAREGPPTFYARWVAPWGLWPLWVLGLGLLLAAGRKKTF